MPVSPVPILFPLAVLSILIGGIVVTQNRYGRCRVTRHVLIAVWLLFLPGVVSQVKGFFVQVLAAGGNPRWQLAYADWLMSERNLHEEFVLAPRFPWNGDATFRYISDAAAQGYIPAKRKYMGWVEADAGNQSEILQVRANYNAYRSELGDVADFSCWRRSSAKDLLLLYVPIAIAVQLLLWRAESRHQQRRIEQEIARGTPEIP